MVTGAAMGIGAAIVRRCLERGWDVLAVDVDEAGLEQLRATCPSVECATLDVRDAGRWDEVVSAYEERVGPLHVLVNNAGICRPGRGDALSLKDERDTIEVNLMGVIHGVRAMRPRFLKRGRGHILNVASMAAFAPSPDLAAYCASKHGVRAYTHSCAIEDRHAPIEYTVVFPGLVETPMVESMRRRAAGVVVFTEQPMTPEALADAVLDAIANPTPEVFVPNLKGRVLRFFGLFPRLIAKGMDGAEEKGREALASWKKPDAS
jgi:short-subunit dehydrogenase